MLSWLVCRLSPRQMEFGSIAVEDTRCRQVVAHPLYGSVRIYPGDSFEESSSHVQTLAICNVTGYIVLVKQAFIQKHFSTILSAPSPQKKIYNEIKKKKIMSKERKKEKKRRKYNYSFENAPNVFFLNPQNYNC